MYIASQILSNAINTVTIFQYVNIVLIVKERFQHVKHLLSEADTAIDVNTSRCVYLEDIMRNSSNKMF
jgi:hypothetical protein